MKRGFVLVILTLIATAMFLAGCGSSAPQEVEVTRVVEIPVEVTRVVEVEKAVEVEVTRVVEVPVEVEVTRLIKPTSTPRPTTRSKSPWRAISAFPLPPWSAIPCFWISMKVRMAKASRCRSASTW